MGKMICPGAKNCGNTDCSCYKSPHEKSSHCTTNEACGYGFKGVCTHYTKSDKRWRPKIIIKDGYIRVVVECDTRSDARVVAGKIRKLLGGI